MRMRQIKIGTSITYRDTASMERYLLEISRIKRISAEDELLLSEKIKQGCQESLHQLVEANLRFVISVCKQYQHQGLPLSDLINEGNCGLMKAARRFDGTKGFKFISYAVWWIRQAILQALADHGRVVRVPLSKVGVTNRTADSVNKNNERMFSMRQLNKALDSLEKETSAVTNRMLADMTYLFPFSSVLDKPWKTDQLSNTEKKQIRSAKQFKQLLPDTAIINVGSTAKSTASSVRMSAESLRSVLEDKNRAIRRHEIEWHRKITLSLACIILFLIGAPLGAIIRKGGLGTPLIFAIVFFMLFYFSSTIGEKFAKENTLTPWVGMWMATIVLLPVGLFLTYKAMRDSKLLNKETYTPLLQLLARFSLQQKK